MNTNNSDNNNNIVQSTNNTDQLNQTVSTADPVKRNRSKSNGSNLTTANNNTDESQSTTNNKRQRKVQSSSVQQQQQQQHQSQSQSQDQSNNNPSSSSDLLSKLLQSQPYSVKQFIIQLIDQSAAAELMEFIINRFNYSIDQVQLLNQLMRDIFKSSWLKRYIKQLNNNNQLVSTNTIHPISNINSIEPESVIISGADCISAIIEHQIVDAKLFLVNIINGLSIQQLYKLINIKPINLSQSQLSQLNGLIETAAAAVVVTNQSMDSASNTKLQLNQMDSCTLELIFQYLDWTDLCDSKRTSQLIHTVSESYNVMNSLIVHLPVAIDRFLAKHKSKSHNVLIRMRNSLVKILHLDTITNGSQRSQYCCIDNLEPYQLPMLRSIFIECRSFPIQFNQLHHCSHISLHLDDNYNSQNNQLDSIADSIMNINNQRQQQLQINNNNNNNTSTISNRLILSLELTIRLNELYENQELIYPNFLTDIGFKSICSIKSLIVLKLAGSYITDDSFSNIRELNNLTILALNDSINITDSGLIALKQLPALTGLNIANCPFITNGSLELISSLSLLELKLTVTSFIDNVNTISAADGLKLLSNSKSITNLTINSSNWYKDNLAQSLIGLITLKYLSINTNDLVTLIGIRSLTKLIQLNSLSFNQLHFEYPDDDDFSDNYSDSKSESIINTDCSGPQILINLQLLINLKQLILPISYYSDYSTLYYTDYTMNIIKYYKNLELLIIPKDSILNTFTTRLELKLINPKLIIQSYSTNDRFPSLINNNCWYKSIAITPFKYY